jgi:acylphosphatase
MDESDKTGREGRVRRIVTYRGDVQGVGFRYTATRVAGRFDVTGCVKNLPDGSVEVVAEGPRDEVDDFLKAVQREMGRHIRDVTSQQGFPTGEWSDFHVEYY